MTAVMRWAEMPSVMVGKVAQTRARERHEEDTMGRRIEMGAPASNNPYRQGAMAGEALTFETFGGPSSSLRRVRRHDDESGPGLTAGDIDTACRQHYRDGFAAGERSSAPALREARAELADAFDEGFVQGRIERAQALAGDVKSGAMAVHFRLQAIENGPKSKAHAALAEVRESVDELLAFVDAVQTNDANAALVADGVTKRLA